jgi:LuxR family transcriptional regulator, maltose regulon positive regulatory protein
MVLQAKVVVPGSDRPLLHRQRLLTALDPTARLVFINGPAGFGKTSLLIHYVQTLSQPVAWYTLDPSDADPSVFLRYLAASLARIAPGLQPTLRRLGDSIADDHQLAAAIAEEINTHLPRATLVLDDLHSIERDGQIAARTSAVLNALLRYCPQIQLVIASRQALPLDGLIMLLARGEARGIDGQALAFTADEIDQLFTQTLGAPDAAERERLSVVCAGWATAVALALTTRSLMGMPISNDRDVLYAYLASQVLDILPADVREFVIDTAVLDYLSGSRCDALRNRSDSLHYLDELIRRNIFLSPAGPDSFRYHPLFREFLLDRLLRQAERYQTLLRAALSLANQEQRWEWIFELAARAGAWEITAEVLREAAEPLRRIGQHATLHGWLQQMPTHVLDAGLWRLKAQLLIDKSDYNGALLALDIAPRASDYDRMLADILRTQVALYQGRLEDAHTLLAPYLDNPDVSPRWLPDLLRWESIRLTRSGDIAGARRRVQQALDLLGDQGDVGLLAKLTHSLGVIESALGNIDQAEQCMRKADGYYEQIGDLANRSILLNNIGVMLLQRGQLDEAEQYVQTALDLAQQMGKVREEAVIYATRGDVALAAGEYARAAEYYAAAYKLASMIDYAWIKYYTLAARTHAARLMHDHPQLQQLLDLLETTDLSVAAQRAQILSARAGAYWELGLPDALAVIEEASQLLQNDTAPERVPLIVLHAQIAFAMEQTERALEVINTLAAVPCATINVHMLRQWASVAPQVVELAAARGSKEAQRILPPTSSNGTALLPATVPPATIPSPAAIPSPSLVIRTLGVERIQRNGADVSVGPRTREVFFCLLAAGNLGIAAETLREAIWGVDGDEQGNALSAALRRIRRTICDVRLDGGVYTLALPDDVDYDAAQCLALLQPPRMAEQLRAALALYQGAYLGRIEQPWIVHLRATLHDRVMDAQLELARLLDATQSREAVALYEAVLRDDPYNTTALIGLMELEVTLGRRPQAIERYRDYAHAMVQDLGIDPDPVVERVYRDLVLSV